MLWSYDATTDGGSANFHGNVSIHGGRLVVGSDTTGEGHLYAFDNATGELLWRQSTRGGFPADLERIGSRLFAVAMTGEVRCVDFESGRLLWSHGGADDERLLRSSVLTTDRRVLVSLPSGEVVALEAESGEEVWTTELQGRLNTSLARIGDRVYVGDVEGRIHGLALKDGRRLATFDAESHVYGGLLSVADCLVALWGADTVACLDPELEQVRWSRKTASTWSSFQPLVWKGHLLVGTESGEIHALDPSDGTTVWMRQLEGEIKGLGAQDDVLYVGTLQGRVYALPLPPP